MHRLMPVVNNRLMNGFIHRLSPEWLRIRIFGGLQLLLDVQRWCEKLVVALHGGEINIQYYVGRLTNIGMQG